MTGTSFAVGTIHAKTSAMPVLANNQYSLQAVVNVLSVPSGGNISIALGWTTATGGTISSISSVPITATGTVTLGLTATAPATAAFANAIVTINGTSGTGDYYVDDVFLSLGTKLSEPYFDGDTTGCAWLGTPGGSPSQQTGTWYWFSYGTSLPLSSSITSPPTFLGFGTVPITVTYVTETLTPGQTYYVAIVGQNAAGTVYGQTVSFIAESPPTAAAAPLVPYGTPSVTIPHFNLPFAMVTTPNGDLPIGIQVVEQDTTEEVLACVTAVVDCPQGACLQLPNFGIPSPTFAQAPIDTSGITQAIQLQEPRATESAVSQLLADGTSWGITLTTSIDSGTQI